MMDRKAKNGFLCLAYSMDRKRTCYSFVGNRSFLDLTSRQAIRGGARRQCRLPLPHLAAWGTAPRITQAFSSAILPGACPARSQKSSGAGPARRAGVARGHPAGGNGSWVRSVPLPFFAKRLQNHCRGYLPGLANTSADFISGRVTGFSKGCPL